MSSYHSSTVTIPDSNLPQTGNSSDSDRSYHCCYSTYLSLSLSNLLVLSVPWWILISIVCPVHHLADWTFCGTSAATVRTVWRIWIALAPLIGLSGSFWFDERDFCTQPWPRCWFGSRKAAGNGLWCKSCFSQWVRPAAWILTWECLVANKVCKRVSWTFW